MAFDFGVWIGLEGAKQYSRDLKRAENRTSRASSSIGKSISTLGGSFGSLGSLTKGLGASLTSLINPATLTAGAFIGMGAAVTSFVTEAAKIETTKAAFNVLTGSAETAKQLLGELRKEAAATPFELGEYQTAARSLLAFGTNANAVTGTLRRLGDISAGIGAPLTQISEIYGKIQVQGRVFGEDINQLTGRGIPIIQELADQFGVSADQVKALVSAGKVGFPEIQKAFESLTDEGGKFNGLTQTLSETLEGRLSTISSLFTEIKAQIGEAFLPAVKDALEFMINAVTALRDPASDLSTVFGNVGTVMNGLRSDISDLGQSIRGTLIKAFGDANGSFETFTNFLTNVLSRAIQNTITGWRLMISVIDVVIDGVGNLVSVYRSIASALFSVVKAIGSAVSSFLSLIGIDLDRWFAAIGEGAGNIVTAFKKAGGAVGVFKSVFLSLKAIGAGVAASIVAPLELVTATLENMAGGVAAFSSALQRGSIDGALDAIKSNFQELGNISPSALADSATNAFKQAHNAIIFEAKFAEPPQIPIDVVAAPNAVTNTSEQIKEALKATGPYAPLDFSKLEPANIDQLGVGLISNEVELLEGVYTQTLSTAQLLREEHRLLAESIGQVLGISNQAATGFLNFANSMGYTDGEAANLAASLKQLGQDVKETLVNLGTDALASFGNTLGSALAEANNFGKALGSSLKETFRKFLPDLLQALGIVLIQSAPSLGFPLGLGAALAGVGLMAAGGFVNARMQNAVSAVSGGGPSFVGSGTSFANANLQAQPQQQFATSGLGSQGIQNNFNPTVKVYLGNTQLTDYFMNEVRTQDELRGK